MDASTRSLLVSTATALVGMLALDLTYGAYARRHFVPDKTLSTAEAQGDGCMLTLGDSRMAAGIDAPSLAGGLKKGGAPRCVATLAIGSTGISGAAMALRRFVSNGRKPAVVVLGESAGTLLPEITPRDASAFFGNTAAELEWSNASDVWTYYPRFPFGELDQGIRFSLARTNSLEIYESATWAKVKAVQERLAGTVEEPHNRFGSISDMRALLGRFREDAMTSLGHFDGHWEASPWFEQLREIVHSCNARLVVVEVPMCSSYRAEVLQTPSAVRYLDWLRAELARTGDLFVDKAAPRTVSDDDFGDGLHLDAAASPRFSSELGEQLAQVLSAAN